MYYNITFVFVKTNQCNFLETEPKCFHDATTGGNITDVVPVRVGREVKLTCSVQYAGTIYPKMHWDKDIPFFGPEQDESSDGEKTQKEVVIRATPADNGKKFACSTYFDSNIRGDTVDDASNNPAYKHTCETPPLIVYCK